MGAETPTRAELWPGAHLLVFALRFCQLSLNSTTRGDGHHYRTSTTLALRVRFDQLCFVHLHRSARCDNQQSTRNGSRARRLGPSSTYCTSTGSPSLKVMATLLLQAQQRASAARQARTGARCTVNDALDTAKPLQLAGGQSTAQDEALDYSRRSGFPPSTTTSCSANASARPR